VTPSPPSGRSGILTATPATIARTVVIFACLLLPWLNPFAPGPSSWAAPWLFSLGCSAVLGAVGHARLPRAGISLAAAAAAGVVTLRSGVTPETVALLGSVAMIWMMAAWSSASASNDAHMRLIAQAWLAAAAVSTAAALLQYFGMADRFEQWVNVSATGEAFANLRQRNQFASLTVIGIAALLWLPASGRARWAAVAAAAWLAIGNAATTSRTGLLELLLIGLVTWRWTGLRSPRMRLWLFAVIAYVVAAIALPWLAEAFAGRASSSLWTRVTESDACGSRSVLWSNVLHLIAQRPWLGWGWGELDFAHYTTLYLGPRFCDILDNAHNLPLHVAVELGVPAAIALCVAIAWVVWRARPWNDDDGVRQLAWTVLLALGVHSLLEYPLWYGPFQIAFGLCLGLLWRAPAGPGGARWTTTVPTAVALLALAAAGYAWWDYHRASQIYLPEEQRAPAWRHDPLARLGGSWLFRHQVRFAELTLTPLTRNNAAWTFESATALLHYSPEPRVIEKLIDSAVVLRRDDVVLQQLARFRAAFPQAYAAWRRENGLSAR
jgi:O-antigen ligase